MGKRSSDQYLRAECKRIWDYAIHESLRACVRALGLCLVCMAAAGAPGVRGSSQRGSAFDPCCGEIFILSVWCAGMATSGFECHVWEFSVCCEYPDELFFCQNEYPTMQCKQLYSTWQPYIAHGGVYSLISVSSAGLRLAYVIGISSLSFRNEFLMTYWSAGEMEAVLSVYRFTMHNAWVYEWILIQK